MLTDLYVFAGRRIYDTVYRANSVIVSNLCAFESYLARWVHTLEQDGWPE